MGTVSRSAVEDILGTERLLVTLGKWLSLYEPAVPRDSGIGAPGVSSREPYLLIWETSAMVA